MRIAVTVVIDMNDEQEAAYAEENGLPRSGGRVYARDVVEHVRSCVLGLVRDSPAFGETGDGAGTRGADVALKR